MQVRSRNDEVEFLCDHCGMTEPVKAGLSATGFMRRFRAFQRVHDWQCARAAREVAIVGMALTQTNLLVERLTAKN